MSNTLENKVCRLSFDIKNCTWDLESHIRSRTVVKNAYASVKMGKKEWTPLGKNCSLVSSPFKGRLGTGLKIRIDYQVDPQEGIQVQQNFIAYDSIPYIQTELVVTNISTQTIHVNALGPLNTKASRQGGIYVGKTPADSLIFENGLTYVTEFFLRGLNASEESNSPWMELIYSKDFKENLLIGVIDKPEDICEIATNDEETQGLHFQDRVGIAELRANKIFPFPKSVAPSEIITSGPWILMVDEKSCFTALETWADLVRLYNNIQLWPHEVPHGWNSWTNPLSEYPGTYYQTKINEDIILQNLEIAVKHLKRFGLTYFQCDAGYSTDEYMTVFEVDSKRFPHGMKYIADKIHEKGLKAGLWINPFNLGEHSKFFLDPAHNNWFPEPDGSFPIRNAWKNIDLSIPAAQEYVRQYVRKVVKEWGFDLLKADFTYLAMAAKKYWNEKITSAEILRIGYKILKEETGPDAFLFGIGGPVGLHWGDVDGERISLDTLPRWGKDHEIGNELSGVLPSYRTFSRRYFYHNRIWLNHLDCLSFRVSLQWHESLCLATAMALLGGIFKIGDKIVDMTPDQFSVVRLMLPIYRPGARPLDVFRTLIPEILALPITKPSLKWHVIGVFHWGPNKDLMTDQPMPDGEKEIRLAFTELGLDSTVAVHVFDFWNERYMGSFHETFGVKLQPHHCGLYSLHPDQGHPQYLSNNRHLTQGAIEIGDIIWNMAEMSLSGTLKLVEDFEHILYLYVPSNFKLKALQFGEITEIKTELDGALMKIRFRIPNKLHDIFYNWKVLFEM